MRSEPALLVLVNEDGTIDVQTPDDADRDLLLAVYSAAVHDAIHHGFSLEELNAVAAAMRVTGHTVVPAPMVIG